MEVGTESKSRPPRDLFISQAIRDKLEDLERRMPRTKQVFQGLMWYAQKGPELGAPMRFRDDHGNWDESHGVMKSPDRPGAPTVRVMYRFDERIVEPLNIWAFPAGSRPAL